MYTCTTCPARHSVVRGASSFCLSCLLSFGGPLTRGLRYFRVRIDESDVFVGLVTLSVDKLRVQTIDNYFLRVFHFCLLRARLVDEKVSSKHTKGVTFVVIIILTIVIKLLLFINSNNNIIDIVIIIITMLSKYFSRVAVKFCAVHLLQYRTISFVHLATVSYTHLDVYKRQD